METMWRRQPVRLGIVVVGAAILVGLGVFTLREIVGPTSLMALGYPGIFLLMALASTTPFLPAPGFAAVIAAGAVANPFLVGLVAGVGSATGELAGYLAGRAGSTLVDRFRDRRLGRWLADALARYGVVAIAILAFVPNPAFDAVGLFAGALGYPVRPLLLACAVGRSVRYVLLAFLGDAALAALG